MSVRCRFTWKSGCLQGVGKILKKMSSPLPFLLAPPASRSRSRSRERPIDEEVMEDDGQDRENQQSPVEISSEKRPTRPRRSKGITLQNQMAHRSDTSSAEELFAALRSRNLERLEIAATRSDVSSVMSEDTSSPMFCTPLYWVIQLCSIKAISQGNAVEMCRCLLKNGANPNVAQPGSGAVGSYVDYPVILVSIFHTTTTGHFHDVGSPHLLPNIQACRFGLVGLFQLLLEYKADLSVVSLRNGCSHDCAAAIIDSIGYCARAETMKTYIATLRTVFSHGTRSR